MIYTLAWAGLVAAAVYAARPRTERGHWAILLLGIPALSAVLTELAVRMFNFNIYRPSVGWPVVVITFYLLPVVAGGGVAAVLHRHGRSADQPPLL